MLENRVTILQRRKAELEAQLELPDLGVAARINTESMLRSTLREIEEAASRLVRTAKVQLTFRGRPVHGTRGIRADFAAEAAESFSRAVQRRSIARAKMAHGGQKSYQAPRPLSIVDVARGSFGFVMQELDLEGIQIGDTHAFQAVQDINEVFHLALDDSEEGFVETVRRLDGGTKQALKDFFEITSAAEASFRIEDEMTDLALEMPAINSASEWLDQIEMEKDVIPLRGKLAGIFDISRKFEFVPDGLRVIHGVLGKDVMLDELRPLEHVRCDVEMQIERTKRKTTERKGRAVYTLIRAKLATDPLTPYMDFNL